MYERDFGSEHYQTEELKSPENRYDYSKFNLENDWFDNDETVEEVIDSIKEGVISEEDAQSLYVMINEQAIMSEPDQEEGPTTNEKEHYQKLVYTATAVYNAIREVIPSYKPLTDHELPGNDLEE